MDPAEMKDHFGIPVKRSDKLAPEYIAKHGNLCVKVDAMPSDQVRELLERAITKRIDMEKWEQTKRIEKEEQEQLESLKGKMCCRQIKFYSGVYALVSRWFCLSRILKAGPEPIRF